MANQPQRPPVRVRFRYNVDTGEIEEFIVDDNAPDRSDDYHDKVAQAFAEPLERQPVIQDIADVEEATIPDSTPAETYPGVSVPSSEETKQPLEE